MLVKLARKSDFDFITVTEQRVKLHLYLKTIQLPMIHKYKGMPSGRSYILVTSFEQLNNIKSQIINEGYNIDWSIFDKISKELDIALKAIYEENNNKYLYFDLQKHIKKFFVNHVLNNHGFSNVKN